MKTKKNLRQTISIKGIRCEYTGKASMMFGKEIFEVEVMEGRNKGEFRRTMISPSHAQMLDEIAAGAPPAPEAATDAAMPDDGGWTDEALREVNEQPAEKPKRARAVKAKRAPAEPRPVIRHHQLEPGRTLTRMFKGAEIRVEITEAGFVYDGQTFKSISACAKAITGYGISGPVFFRLDVDGSK